MPPLEALRALTLVPAQRLRLHDRGAVRPGLRADLLVVPSLAEFTPSVVVTGGRVAAVEGRSLAPEPGPPESPFSGSVRIGPLTGEDLEWRVDLPDGDHDFRALRVNPADTSTVEDITRLPVRGGVVCWAGRTAVAVVFERHSGSGRATVAPVTGFGLQPGAVATTYAHDAHNLLVVAATPGAGLLAANTVIGTGGGICVADGHQVTAALPLPIGGVMSGRPAAEVAARSLAVRRALRRWGWDHANPFMSISTLTLPVSPAIKLTDRGLVDVTARRLVPATVGDQHPAA
jgi:adenine deaminase